MNKYLTDWIPRLLILLLLTLGISIMHLRNWTSEIFPEFASFSTVEISTAWGHWLSIFDLQRLPLELKLSLSVLLLLPIGALVTALCRNLIGVVTYGTFGPALLALALTSTDWRIGLITIVVVLVLGFFVRSFLDKLRLLMVPRHGIILTLVVLGMTLESSVMNYLDPDPMKSTTLLPTIILIGLIERIFHTTSEEGILYTSHRLMGTAFVGYCCYLVFSSQALAHLVLSYPEVHCLTLAGMVGVGRYSGYRLSELRRFNGLTQALQPLQKPSSTLNKAVRISEYWSRLSGQFLLILKVLKKRTRSWHYFTSRPVTYLNRVLFKRSYQSEVKVLENAPELQEQLVLSWTSPSQLREQGILGINRRNADYILKYNPRSLYPYLDNKILTKRLCQDTGIPCPQTYAILQGYHDIKHFPEMIQDYKEFVIKPARGAGGRGVLVIANHNGQLFDKSDGTQLTLADVQYHLSTILSGFHSLNHEPDQVLVEQRILPHPGLQGLVVGGTPDIRIILFQGIPVMAMIRLPTRKSQGRANLHQGAVATAIDLVTGTTIGGVCQNQMVVVHPDTGCSLQGLQIPDWDAVLQAAIKLGSCIDMGYIGVDLVIDTRLGPVVLDVNARPGLAIQVANRCGLLHRLEFVASQPQERLSLEDSLKLLQQFQQLTCGSDVRHSTENPSAIAHPDNSVWET